MTRPSAQAREVSGSSALEAVDEVRLHGEVAGGADEATVGALLVDRREQLHRGLGLRA
jgi:hypothetical protein